MPVGYLVGDVIEVLKGYNDESFVACFCDPPYGLGAQPDMTEVLTHWLAGETHEGGSGGFMSKTWDSFVPGPEYWREIARVLKPGGIVFAFAGTRTADLLSIAMRLAGLERFDVLFWAHGVGFPKSHSLEKSTGDANFAGYGTALKPTVEFCLFFRKPRLTTYAATALEHGSGALNIDECRISHNEPEKHTVRTAQRTGIALQMNTGSSAAWQEGTLASPSQAGRWPANLLLSHSPGCVRRGKRRVKSDSPAVPQPKFDSPTGIVYGFKSGEGRNGEMSAGYADADGLETVADFLCEPDCPVRLLGEQSGVSKDGTAVGRNKKIGVPTKYDASSYMFGGGQGRDITYGKSGTAARFFKNFDPPLRFCPLSDAVPTRWKYSSKASRTERDAGLEGFKAEYRGTMGEFKENPGRTVPKGGGTPSRNSHPCLKPLAVTRYLATLLRPPEAYLDDATILVPFCGSGSEMIGALLAGWRNVVGIELDAEYVAIAEARLTWWAKAMALTHETEPGAILSAMKGRDIDEAVQGEMFNTR